SRPGAHSKGNTSTASCAAGVTWTRCSSRPGSTTGDAVRDGRVKQLRVPLAEPCQPSVKVGSQAAVHTRLSLPMTNTSSLSLLRDTAVTGAPGAALPPLSVHQPCNQSVKAGSHAAVTIAPLTSVAKISNLSVLRDTA